MASTVFKKREGLLKLSKNQESVSWTPITPPGSKPEVNVPVKNITNLQQTPPSSAKVKMKVFAQTSGAVEPITYTFDFSSPTKARAEADSLRDALSKAIQVAKAEGNPLAAPGGKGSAPAAAMAATVSSAPAADSDAWYDDKKLLTNDNLQRSLLQANPALSKTLMESLRTKPEAISMSQFTSQFWSSRVNLLRAHAIETSQTKGAYNVLSSVKTRVEDSKTKLNISKEQIHMLFSQHPLVKRVYDENVPKLNEREFWAKFFQSRLLKKLKGEKITEADAQDAVFDRYLSYDESTALEKRIAASHVPHIIDLAGNEENHSQRKGNAPDLLMRPTAVDRVPIIRALNSLSEKIMLHVTPSDVDPSQPIGMDEETFNNLALRDLQGDAAESRIILNVRDQNRFFARGRERAVDPDVARYAKQDPAAVLAGLRADLAPGAAETDIGAAIGFDDASDSSSDEDDPAPPPSHVGSKAALRAASRQISAAIAAQREQSDDLSTDQLRTAVYSAAFYGLPDAVYDRVLLTHATTTEFLQHFWAAFLSGDAGRVDEIRNLIETLDRAMDRVRAVADEAEAERDKKVEEQKARLEEFYRRKGKRRAFDFDSIKGGAKAVRQLMEPTVEAIKRASREYAKALKEQEGPAAA